MDQVDLVQKKDGLHRWKLEDLRTCAKQAAVRLMFVCFVVSGRVEEQEKTFFGVWWWI